MRWLGCGGGKWNSWGKLVHHIHQLNNRETHIKPESHACVATEAWRNLQRIMVCCVGETHGRKVEEKMRLVNDPKFAQYPFSSQNDQDSSQIYYIVPLTQTQVTGNILDQTCRNILFEGEFTDTCACLGWCFSVQILALERSQILGVGIFSWLVHIGARSLRVWQEIYWSFAEDHLE